MQANKVRSKAKEIFDNDEHVSNYEQKVKRSNWLGPEIMLGLAFRHVKSGEKILDLGIGTGLCSELFHKAGLAVYGLDFSEKMLNICRRKNFASELKKYDLCQIPYPYANGSMDHAVCGGVTHIFEDIEPIFREVSRITRRGGIFTFCSMDMAKPEPLTVETSVGATVVFSHGAEEIELLLEEHRFKLINSLAFEIDSHNTWRHFTAYVVENTKV